MKIKVSNVNTPNWKEVTVKSRIPEELEKLSEIARNIWWAWNFEATELFRDCLLYTSGCVRFLSSRIRKVPSAWK